MSQQEIINRVKNLFLATDERDWPAVKATMNENVLLDYSSMTGLSAAIVSPSDIIREWSSFLPGFDSTRHHVYDFHVDAEENVAIAYFKGKAGHYLDGSVWHVEGNYEVKLKLTNGEWLTNQIDFKLDVISVARE